MCVCVCVRESVWDTEGEKWLPCGWLNCQRADKNPEREPVRPVHHFIELSSSLIDLFVSAPFKPNNITLTGFMFAIFYRRSDLSVNWLADGKKMTIYCFLVFQHEDSRLFSDSCNCKSNWIFVVFYRIIQTLSSLVTTLWNCDGHLCGACVLYWTYSLGH